MRIDHTIQALRFSRGSIIYTLEIDRGLVVVDTGSNPQAAHRLVEYLKQRDREPEEIKYIFLTHWHGDHSGGAEELRRITGAKIICHQDDAPLLSGSSEIESLWGKRMPRTGLNPILRMVCAVGYGFMNANTDSLLPDLVVGSGPAPFDPGWEVIHLPGHTPGSCGLWSPERKILFAGDTLICIFSRIMLPISFLIECPDKIGNSLHKLRDLGHIEWILPGHFLPLRWKRTLKNW